MHKTETSNQAKKTNILYTKTTKKMKKNGKQTESESYTHKKEEKTMLILIPFSCFEHSDECGQHRGCCG